jgi:hypothetical protein
LEWANAVWITRKASLRSNLNCSGFVPRSRWHWSSGCRCICTCATRGKTSWQRWPILASRKGMKLAFHHYNLHTFTPSHIHTFTPSQFLESSHSIHIHSELYTSIALTRSITFTFHRQITLTFILSLTFNLRSLESSRSQTFLTVNTFT